MIIPEEMDIPEITPQDEKRIIEELINEAESNLKQGNLYYVVSNRWIMRWHEYTEQDTNYNLLDNKYSNFQYLSLFRKVERPGPIDNSDIVSTVIDSEDDEQELRRGLLEGLDYELVPQPAWQKLIEWYGGEPALPRKLISNGQFIEQFSVGVYPLCLKLLDSRDESQSIVRLSRKATLKELYEKVCELREVEPEKARIWDYYSQIKHGILENSNIEISQLMMDQEILLEVKVDGSWGPQSSMDCTGNELALVLIEPTKSPFTIAGGPSLSNGHSLSYGSSFFQGSYFGSGSTKVENSYEILKNVEECEKQGLVGLENLGFTCFMNSAVQCLAHTPPIIEYFLQDYSDEINMENPLGLQGELALAFGALLRKLWSPDMRVIAPRAFKAKLGRFAPQFSGFNQHDSQELLAFLLDGLHEDLNRIMRKPYFEAKDSENRPDAEVAEECWRNHKARNDSIIVDVCQGQYKSTLVCPVCSKVSITFDPFMYLSLPLPSMVTRSITATVFYSDGSSLPTSYTVKVLKEGVCRDLIQALATACCLKIDENLLLAEVYGSKFFRHFDLLKPLSTIMDMDCIVAYRFPKNSAELTRVEICHRYQGSVETNFLRKRFSELTDASHFRCLSDSLKGSEWKLFLTPLVTYVAKSQTEADIELAVRSVMLPLKRDSLISSIKKSDGMENTSSGSGTELDIEEMGVRSSNGDSALRLCITDSWGFNCICRPLLKDSNIEPCSVVRVFLDWTSEEFDFYDPDLLKGLPKVRSNEASANKNEEETISLFSCLDAYVKEEPLGPDDMWYCPSCKEHRQATKKLDLWRLPDILIFHLKRFSYGQYMKHKLESFVDFDIHNLDLSKYVKCEDASQQSHVYQLYAISNHYGGLGGGHYTAYAKLFEDNGWYHFDDSHVSPIEESDVKTCAAYVLFYKRVTTEEASSEPSETVESTAAFDEFPQSEVNT